MSKGNKKLHQILAADIKDHYNISLCDVFKNAYTLIDDSERVIYLKNHPKVVFIKQFVSILFDERYDFKDIPNGKTDYQTMENVGIETMFYNEIRRLYIFSSDEEIGVPSIDARKRMGLWYSMLEGIDSNDAAMLDKMKDGKFQSFFGRYGSKRFSEKFFKEMLFPELFNLTNDKNSI